MGPDDQGFTFSSHDGRGVGTPAAANCYGDPLVGDDLTALSIDYVLSMHHQPFFLYLSHWDVHRPTRSTPARENASRAHLAELNRSAGGQRVPFAPLAGWRRKQGVACLATRTEGPHGVVRVAKHTKSRTPP